jgi:hypothetical protein
LTASLTSCSLRQCSNRISVALVRIFSGDAIIQRGSEG